MTSLTKIRLIFFELFFRYSFCKHFKIKAQMTWLLQNTLRIRRLTWNTVSTFYHFVPTYLSNSKLPVSIPYFPTSNPDDPFIAWLPEGGHRLGLRGTRDGGRVARPQREHRLDRVGQLGGSVRHRVWGKKGAMQLLAKRAPTAWTPGTSGYLLPFRSYYYSNWVIC